MKLSKFNIWVEDYPRKGEYLLFNTRTQALIKIDQAMKRSLNAFPYSLSANDSLLKKNLAALKQSGIIVQDEKEEERKIEDFFRQLKYESRALTFEATILTTYACNFKCVYCFEASVRNNVFLDTVTSQLIIKWLINKAEERGLKKIYLVYYGGEPLLNIGPIYDISWHMKEWADRRGINFGFGIITNGSLVNADLVGKFLPVGLKNVRVTVDGYKEAHDKKRPFSDGRPTFDLIMRNIKSIIDMVPVGIAGNFDRENVGGIFELIEYLDREGILKKLNRLIFAPIVPRLGPKDNPANIELSECLKFLDKDGLFLENLNIKRELIKRGAKINTGLAINACPLTMEDAGVTIDPTGLIYKCNSLVGYPEFCIGDVRNQRFNDKFQEFLNIDAWNKCPKDCPYVPMCQGGCRFFSYVESGNFSDLSCKREYFQRAIPELIKLEYEKKQKERQLTTHAL